MFFIVWATHYYSQILNFYLTMKEILMFEKSFLLYMQRNFSNLDHGSVFSLTHPRSLKMPLLRGSPVFWRVKLPWKVYFPVQPCTLLYPNFSSCGIRIASIPTITNSKHIQRVKIQQQLKCKTSAVTSRQHYKCVFFDIWLHSLNLKGFQGTYFAFISTLYCMQSSLIENGYNFSLWKTKD